MLEAFGDQSIAEVGSNNITRLPTLMPMAFQGVVFG